MAAWTQDSTNKNYMVYKRKRLEDKHFIRPKIVTIRNQMLVKIIYLVIFLNSTHPVDFEIINYSSHLVVSSWNMIEKIYMNLFPNEEK